MSSSGKLFEAFFWLEPGKADPNGPFASTRVLLHYPQDVSAITREFREIPQYCFPDLERIKSEKAENCRNEFIVFTLMDNSGQPLYCTCMRNLFRGISRRHDVRRRPMHALCFVSRYPYLQLFRSLLFQLFGFGLVEQHAGSVRTFLDIIYTRAVSNVTSGSSQEHGSIAVARALMPEFLHDYTVSAPLRPQVTASLNPGAGAGGTGPIVFLLESLGVEKSLIVLSAVLCEKRVIFLADEAISLTSSALGVLALMQPFQYTHTFVPLLPTPFLTLAALKTPYVLGVRRYQGSQLARIAYGDVVVVDVDKGEIYFRGNAVVRDFVGESGTALKQASESFDRVKQRAMGFFRSPAASSASLEGANSSEPRPDVVAAVLSDLKAAIGAKPTANSVAQLFRSLPGGSKATVDEQRVQWALETERTAREALLLLWVYLFADVDDFINQPKGSKQEVLGNGCDASALISRRASVGDSRAVQEFLNDFLRSQAWLRFFEDTVSKRSVSGPSCVVGGWGRVSPSALAACDDFEAVCTDVRANRVRRADQSMAVTLAAVKAAVAQRVSATSGAGDGVGGVNKGMTGGEYHALTVLHTAPVGADGASSSSSGGVSSTGGSGDYDPSTEYKICREAAQTADFPLVIQTIAARLEVARAALMGGARSGSPGLAGGLKALVLLRALLVTGPESALAAALDLLPVLRALLAGCNRKNSTGESQGSTAAVSSLRAAVMSVLELILDHKKLYLQRRCSLLCRTGAYPHLLLQTPPSPLFSPFSHAKLHKRQSDALRKDLLTPASGQGRQLPAFTALHAAMRPPNVPATDPALVRCGVPVAKGEDLDDEEEALSTRQLVLHRPAAKADGAVVDDLLDTSFDAPTSSSTVSMSSSSFVPSVSANASASQQSSFSNSGASTSDDDDARYRIVNQDTGEVLDLRYDLSQLSGLSGTTTNGGNRTAAAFAPSTSSSLNPLANASMR